MAIEIFNWYGNEIIAQVNKRSNKETIELATKILLDAKANCPYDSGPRRNPTKIHLRDTGKIVVLKGNKVEIRFTAPHAGIVHDGTTRMPARPFLAEAMMRNAPELVKRTKQVVTRG